MDVDDAVIGMQGIELAVEDRGECCQGLEGLEGESATGAVWAIVADVDVEPARLVRRTGEVSPQNVKGLYDCFHRPGAVWHLWRFQLYACHPFATLLIVWTV